MVESLYQPLCSTLVTAEEKLLPQGFRVIFSGNIGIAQDIENIIAAANLLKNYKNIKWIFLGDGSKRQWLEENIQTQALSETVFWLGQHPVVAMPRFFACADALLVSLKKDPVFSLTIPGKIQSYLASAKPIIASLDGEGGRIITEAQAGFVSESSHAQSLAENVLKLSQLEAQQRKQLGLNGYQYFNKHFQRESLLGQLEQWMKELQENHSLCNL
ncbi:MAG: group glycosyltransferase [uncultured bacterium]|nr:MAG: group glycosyltransferase [uncultured bacterium]